MKQSTYSIQIPEPCHEDWNSMQPEAQGKFCMSCCKSVIDFSNKTDAEIKTILMHYKDQKVCGHFKSTQLNRPLNIRLNLDQLPVNMSSTKSFALALFLVFGTFLFNCTDLQGQKINTIEVNTTEDAVYTKGKIRCTTPAGTKNIISPPDTVEKISEVEVLIGDVIFVEEPLVSDTPAVQKIPVVNLDSLLRVNPEIFVGGSISFNEEPIEEELPLIDSIISIPEERFTRGEVYEMTEPENNTSPKTSEKLTLLKTKENFPENSMPLKPELLIYPNPSASRFTIRYDVLKRSDVRVDLLNDAGMLLRTLVDISDQYEGQYNIPVDVDDLASGIYIISLINNGERFTERVVLEK